MRDYSQFFQGLVHYIFADEQNEFGPVSGFEDFVRDNFPRILDIKSIVPGGFISRYTLEGKDAESIMTLIDILEYLEDEEEITNNTLIVYNYSTNFKSLSQIKSISNLIDISQRLLLTDRLSCELKLLITVDFNSHDLFSFLQI